MGVKYCVSFLSLRKVVFSVNIIYHLLTVMMELYRKGNVKIMVLYQKIFTKKTKQIAFISFLGIFVDKHVVPNSVLLIPPVATGLHAAGC